MPKTLIFAKDDAHAEEIVTTVREVFGKGNDFAAKITYTATRPQGPAAGVPHLADPAHRGHRRHDRHRHRRQAAGVRVLHARRPLGAVLRADEGPRRAHHRRRPTSRPSRPTRTTKTRFVIVDAVGVTEHDFVDPPLNREKGVSLKKLLDKAAALTLTEDETATLASRLAKLELQLTPEERAELDEVAGGPVRDIVRGLVDAVDPDTQAKASRRPPTGGRRPGAARRGRRADRRQPRRCAAGSSSCAPPTTGSSTRSASTSCSTPTASSTPTAPGRVVESWRAYLDEHRDEITAIQLLNEAKERRVAVRRHPGARRPHRPPAAQLDPRRHLGRLRGRRRRPRSGTATGTP